jgi:hypothetical protein
MPDTVLGGYSCPCGWRGNSRQALHWHKQNSCKLREQPDASQEPAKAPQIEKVEQAEPAPVVQEKPAKVALAGSQKAEPEPDDEDDEEEDEPEEKESFEPFLIPIIIVVFLVAGLIIFREKIVEMFEKMKGGQPPAYGVPSYG